MFDALRKRVRALKLPKVLLVNGQAKGVFHQRACWLSREKSFERLWEQRIGDPADVFRMREILEEKA